MAENERLYLCLDRTNRVTRFWRGFVSLMDMRYTPALDTVHEKNIGNNLLYLTYVVADDQPPELRVDSTTADVFDRPYSPVSKVRKFVTAGAVKTRHNKGKIQLSIVVQDTLGTELFRKEQELSNDVGFNDFEQELGIWFESQESGHYVVQYHAVDKYANDSIVTIWLNLDATTPTVNEWKVNNGVIDSSARDLALSFGDTSLIALSYTYYIGNFAAVLNWTASDDIGLGKYRIRSLAEDVLAEGDISGTIDSGQSSLELSTGYYLLEAEDLAGNRSRSYLHIKQDTSKPWIEAYQTTRNMMDSINNGLNITPLYIIDNPLYLHVLDTFSRSEEEKKNKTMSPPANPEFTEKLISQQGNWTHEMEVIEIDTLKVVLNGIDQGPLTWSVEIDGQGVDEYTYNPYVQASDLRVLDSVYEVAVRNHRSNLYLEIPVLRQAKLVQITATDLMNNATTVTIDLKRKGVSKYEDAPADRSQNAGPDFGDLYLASESNSGETWLHALVHSFENYSLQSAPVSLYLDWDGDSLSGTSGSFNPTGELKGFEYRIQFSPPTNRDSDTLSYVRFQSWSGSTWTTIDSSTTQNPSANQRIDANQFNQLWSSNLGEGHQVLPSGKIAYAPGGGVEFSVKLSATPADTVPFFLEGEYDAVYDTATGGPLFFVLGPDRSMTADAFVADWYDLPEPPLAFLEQFHANAKTKHIVGDSVMQVSFMLRNDGFVPNDSLILQYLLQLPSPCNDIEVLGDPAAGKFRIHSAATQANQFAKYRHLNDDVFLLQVMLRDSILTAGTEFIGFPTISMTGTACVSAFENNQIQPLENNVKLEAWDPQWFLMPRQ